MRTYSNPLTLTVAIAVSTQISACGPAIVEPAMRPMPDCVAGKMDPDAIHLAIYSGSPGGDWFVEELERTNGCYGLEGIRAGIIDSTTAGLVYLGDWPYEVTGIYRYTWDRWDDDLPEDLYDFDFPQNLNELNELLSPAYCPDTVHHRLFVSPADGSIYYQCKDGKTYDLGERQVLADLDILLAIGTDGRFLVSRVSEQPKPQPDRPEWFDHPPAMHLGELSGDGRFHPIVVPPSFAGLTVVAARSSDDAFLIAVQDEAGTVSVLRTRIDATAEVVGQVAPAEEIVFTGAATGVLDSQGNFAYTSAGLFVFRSLDGATMTWGTPSCFDCPEVHAVITGP